MNYVLAILIYLALMLAPAQQAGPRYAAPYGAGTACTDTEPCSLATALSGGGLVYALPGTYAGAWVISVPGTTLESASGGRARLDGSLTIRGAGSTVRGLEISNTSWTTRQGDTLPQQSTCVCVFARDVTIERNVIHDLGRGVEAFNGAGGATAGLIIRHNLLYNIGWRKASGQGTGHAIYLQNDDAGRKRVEGNVISGGYGFTLHLYGSGAATLRHFDIDRNTTMFGRWLVGGGAPASDIHARQNLVYGDEMQFGYAGVLNDDLELRDNVIGGTRWARLHLERWAGLDATGNTIAVSNNVSVLAAMPLSGTLDLNTYHNPSATSFLINGEPGHSLTGWQARTGHDAGSTYSAAMPSAPSIYVEPWSAHRGHVTVFNWADAQTVTLDLAPMGLTAGAQYQLINAQNPAERLTFQAGSPVPIPMTGWTVAAPYGGAPLRAWDSRFAVFLVEPSWA